MTFMIGFVVAILAGLGPLVAITAERRFLMTTYYCHLGWDFNSYTIGTVWGNASDISSSSTSYWLQYCLTTNQTANSTGAAWNPALYSFAEGDLMYLVLWDLTQYALSSTNTTSPALQLTLDQSGIGLNTTAGTYYSASNASPVTLSTSPAVTNLEQSTGSNSNYYFNLMTQPGWNYAWYTTPYTSPWGQSLAQSSSTIGPVKFSSSTAQMFKMNFRMTVQYQAGVDVNDNPIWSTAQVFIADPAPIIDGGRPIVID